MIALTYHQKLSLRDRLAEQLLPKRSGPME